MILLSQGSLLTTFYINKVHLLPNLNIYPVQAIRLDGVFFVRFLWDYLE